MSIRLINNGHCERVAQMAGILCRALGLNGREAADVRTAALLHDVGKVVLPRTLLCKRGGLTADEFAMVAMHPVIGAGIASGLGHGQEVCRGVLHHHERFDGNGYPDRLAGGQIPRAARVIAVADSFDVMVSDRPYAASMSTEAALAEIARCAGTQFDPTVAAAFVGAVKEMLDCGQARAARPTRGCERAGSATSSGRRFSMIENLESRSLLAATVIHVSGTFPGTSAGAGTVVPYAHHGGQGEGAPPVRPTVAEGGDGGVYRFHGPIVAPSAPESGDISQRSATVADGLTKGGSGEGDADPGVGDVIGWEFAVDDGDGAVAGSDRHDAPPAGDGVPATTQGTAGVALDPSINLFPTAATGVADASSLASGVFSTRRISNGDAARPVAIRGGGNDTQGRSDTTPAVANVELPALEAEDHVAVALTGDVDSTNQPGADVASEAATDGAVGRRAGFVGALVMVMATGYARLVGRRGEEGGGAGAAEDGDSIEPLELPLRRT